MREDGAFGGRTGRAREGRAAAEVERVGGIAGAGHEARPYGGGAVRSAEVVRADDRGKAARPVISFGEVELAVDALIAALDPQILRCETPVRRHIIHPFPVSPIRVAQEASAEWEKFYPVSREQRQPIPTAGSETMDTKLLITGLTRFAAGVVLLGVLLVFDTFRGQAVRVEAKMQQLSH